MNRKHALIISLLLAVAVFAGGFALLRTASAGSSSGSAASDQSIAAKRAALDRYEAALNAALAKKPPKLPALATAPAAGVSSAVPERVTYVQAEEATAPTAGGDDDQYEHEDEAEHEGGEDD